MKPRKVLADETKIPDKKLEQFLLDLVNAHVTGGDVTVTEDDAGAIFHLYSKFLPHAPSKPQEAQQNFPLLIALMRRWMQFHPGRLPEGKEPYQRGIVAEMRDRLQAIWTAGDPKVAKWRLRGFQSFMHEVLAAGSTPEPTTPDAPPPGPDVTSPKALPTDAPLSQALAYLWRKLRNLKTCAYRKCRTPFFVGKRRENLTCSEECAAAMRGDYKRRWWRGKLRIQGKGKQPGGEPVAKEGGVKSSGVQGEQPRIADSEVKAFILDVVNADDKKIDDGKMYFFSRYPKFFPTRDQDVEAVASLARRNPRVVGQLRSEFPRMYHRGLIRNLCEGLRSVWRAKDDSTAEREFFKLHSLVHRQMDIRAAGDRTLRPPSAHAPIHQALRWVRQHLSKLRKCGNNGCAHPYFVATGKQRFCSEECAHVGQKASKRRSWGKHGPEWRRKPAKGKGGPDAPMLNPEQP